MIIALSGQANNGKDEAGRIFIELAKREGIHLKRIACADTMKVLAAKSLGYDGLDQSYCDIGSEIEFINDIKDRDIQIEYSYSTPYYPSDLTNHHIGTKVITGREYLINFGQTMKEHFGEQFWVDLAFSEIAPWPDLVVTDLRFEEEARYVRNLDGYIIHISREKDQQDGDLEGEKKIPETYIDYYLDNTGTIQDLKKNCKIILDKIVSDYDYYEDDYLENDHIDEEDYQ